MFLDILTVVIWLSISGMEYKKYKRNKNKPSLYFTISALLFAIANIPFIKDYKSLGNLFLLGCVISFIISIYYTFKEQQNEND